MAFGGRPTGGWSGLALVGLPELAGQRPAGDPEFAPPLERLVALTGRWGAEKELEADLEADYVRLFVGGPGGVAAPPYASCHASGERRVMGPEALDMARRLEAAGLAPVGGEPPDHLARELEYLVYLLTRAWAGGEPGKAAEASSFAARDVLPWFGRFSEVLARADATGFFTQCAALVKAALEAVARLPEEARS